MTEQLERIERRIRWRDLKMGMDLSMAAFTEALRFGMLINVANTRQYKCYACEVTFVSIYEAKQHPCEYEDEFRNITHRTEAVFRGRQDAGEKVQERKPIPMTVEQQGTFVTETIYENKHLRSLADELENSVKGLIDELDTYKKRLETSDNLVASLQEQLATLRSAKIQRDNQEPYR